MTYKEWPDCYRQCGDCEQTRHRDDMVLVTNGQIDPQEDHVCINCASKRITELATQLSARDAELAAEREAVRVLGEYAYWNDTDSAAKHLTSDSKLDAVNKRIEEAMRAVFNNPLARASVEKAGKQ